MKKVIINTQAELDAIEINAELEIVIVGGTEETPIELNKLYELSNVILSGNAVISMRGNSQVKDMRDNSQVKDMWDNSQVKDMRDNSQVKDMWDNSQVKDMWDNSQVKDMRDNSQVKDMRGNSQVKDMWDNSQVKDMRDNSQVKDMRGNSQVNYMWDNSQVKDMRDNSQVKDMRGNAMCKSVTPSNKILCFGYNFVFIERNSDISNITLNETSQIIYVDSFKSQPTIDFYLKNYPIKKKDNNTLLMFKSVHKDKDGTYFSDYDNNFKYRLNEKVIHDNPIQNEKSCDTGLHASDLHFAVNFGKEWPDISIIECEIPIDKIVVCKDCDGKIRTSELTPVRELERSEYEHLI